MTVTSAVDKDEVWNQAGPYTISFFFFLSGFLLLLLETMCHKRLSVQEE